MYNVSGRYNCNCTFAKNQRAYVSSVFCIQKPNTKLFPHFLVHSVRNKHIAPSARNLLVVPPPLCPTVADLPELSLLLPLPPLPLPPPPLPSPASTTAVSPSPPPPRASPTAPSARNLLPAAPLEPSLTGKCLCGRHHLNSCMHPKHVLALSIAHYRSRSSRCILL